MATVVVDHPLDPKLEALLDAQFVEFYNKALRNQPAIYELDFKVARQAINSPSPVINGGGGVIGNIASRQDFDLNDFQVRVFTPNGICPSHGWPALIWFHGGGWVLGNINSDNSLCTDWCSRVECVVIHVNYRHAPEYPFPAAVDDSWEAFKWINSQAPYLNIDVKRLAVGGASAGGNLAANLAHKVGFHVSLQQGENNDEAHYYPLVLQLLAVPAVDNANRMNYDSFKNYITHDEQETMMWFKNKYFPNESMISDARSSPISYPDQSFKHLPPTYLAIAELDVLSGEGIAYHQKLKRLGIDSTLKVYKGMPHVFFGMSTLLEKAAEALEDTIQILKKSFDT